MGQDAPLRVIVGGRDETLVSELLERFGQRGWICLFVGRADQVLELLGADQADLAVLDSYLASGLTEELAVPLVRMQAGQAWVIDQEVQRVAPRAFAERQERGRRRPVRRPTPTPLPPVERFPLDPEQALLAYLDEGSGAQRLPTGQAVRSSAGEGDSQPQDSGALHSPPRPLAQRTPRRRAPPSPARGREPDEGSDARRLPSRQGSGARRLPLPEDSSARRLPLPEESGARRLPLREGSGALRLPGEESSGARRLPRRDGAGANPFPRGEGSGARRLPPLTEERGRRAYSTPHEAPAPRGTTPQPERAQTARSTPASPAKPSPLAAASAAAAAAAARRSQEEVRARLDARMGRAPTPAGETPCLTPGNTRAEVVARRLAQSVGRTPPPRPAPVTDATPTPPEDTRDPGARSGAPSTPTNPASRGGARASARRAPFPMAPPPDDPQAATLMAHGRLAMLDNRMSDAAALFLRAWEQEPRCHEACSLSGWCLLRAHPDNEMTGEALERLHSAALLSHGDALCTLRLGMGQELVGQRDRAKEQLRLALEADPTLEEAREALARLERALPTPAPSGKAGGLGGILGSLFGKE